MIESSDPYLYPGIGVLRNLRGLRDAATFAEFEAGATVQRILELGINPPRGDFDVRHLKAIHGHIFQDVFDWAGQFRTVNISKGGHLFGAAAFLEAALHSTFDRLRKEDYLKGADPQRLAIRAGYYLGEINAAHPFRDGNGRAQREFIRALALQAGFIIDWARVTRDESNAASRKSATTGDSSGLVEVVRKSLR